MLSRINGWQLFIIILAVIILIGWKRLPDAARSLGRSLRIFKSEVEQMADKDDKPSAASTDTVEAAHHRDAEGVHRRDVDAVDRAPREPAGHDDARDREPVTHRESAGQEATHREGGHHEGTQGDRRL